MKIQKLDKNGIKRTSFQRLMTFIQSQSFNYGLK